MELKDLTRQYCSIKPDPVWRQKSQTELLAYFSEKFPVQKKEFGLYYFFKPTLATLLVLAVLLLGSFGTLQAAKKSLPGDLLYPVKRFSEKIQLSLVSNRTEKAVLRAEILTTRLTEAKVLAEKFKTKNEEKIAPRLVKAAQEMHREIKVLQKEIASQVQKEKIDVTIDEGSLPIQDGRQVVKAILSEELEQVLKQTKALLKEKNLATALAKTAEAEKQFVETKPNLPEDTSGKSEASKESEILEKPVLETTPLKPKQVLQDKSATTMSKEQVLEPESADFKIIPEREESIKIDLIRE